MSTEQWTRMWAYAIVIIAVAILGKFGGATLTARATGLRWADATRLGILVNTRGLVELVVLNVGLELGILSSALFTMLVLMAIVTTLITAPLVRATRFVWREDQSAAAGTAG